MVSSEPYHEPDTTDSQLSELLVCDIKTSLELQKHLEGSVDPPGSTSERQPDRYPKCRFMYAHALSI